jgi:hypothetical protein
MPMGAPVAIDVLAATPITRDAVGILLKSRHHNTPDEHTMGKNDHQ